MSDKNQTRPGMLERIRSAIRKIPDGLSGKKIALILLGAAICSFGIHNIHQQVGVTEGGIIGLMLLAEHWLGFSPSVLTTILDISCYLLALKYLGGRFIKISVLSTLCVSLFYEFWELFPHMLPNLSSRPLLAAVLGGLFVGTGVGIIVRQGGSAGGDDALALTISHLSHWRLSFSYLFTDLTVLALSLTYIPFSRIIYSVVTVTVSSWLIDSIKDFGKAKEAVTE